MHQHIVTSPDNPPPADAAPLISVAKPADTLPGASVTLDASATTAKATVTSPVGR
jgi:hypothetical protein